MIPYIYTLVDQGKLKEMLSAFHSCLDLPIQVIDENGVLLVSSQEPLAYCSIIGEYLKEDNSCEEIHLNASKKAVNFGETYAFSCPGGLSHIVFPLMNKDMFFGSIIVGPFLMEPANSAMISEVSKRLPIPTSKLLKLYEASSQVKVIHPSLVTQISKLIYYIFSSLIIESKQLLMDKQGKLTQQTKITESMQMYNRSLGIDDATPTYPLEKEQELIVKVKTGNTVEAKGVLNELLGYVLFVDGDSLDIMKSRALELCALLSRASMEGGSYPETILNLNNQFIRDISQCNDSEDLCYILQDTVETFTENMFNNSRSKNKDLMKKAITFISKNYANSLTLEYVASQVHLNPAYFSSLFKKESGFSFKEYLNMVRIEESKRLLTNTDYTIVDIAIAVGFEDQSYFSKVFKKYTGVTPKQFR